MKKSLEPDKNFYEYVKINAKSDVSKLRLTASGHSYCFPIDFAITQIASRQKASRKLATFIGYQEFLFPSELAAEQSTHQCVAAYHSSLIGSGKHVLDMTAGLGIDAITAASAGNIVTAIELDECRADVLRHNARLTGTSSLNVINADSVKWLSELEPDTRFDIIFSDPARRDGSNRKTYFFKDCLPDIVTNFDIIRAHASKIMIKASPILDISQAQREIHGISEIHIVCVKGECKEVLLIADCAEETLNPIITAVDLDDCEDATVSVISKFKLETSRLAGTVSVAELDDITPGSYIYDPNAAIHKINCAKTLCERFDGLKRISDNTDLYVSQKLFSKFPGRMFRIERIVDSAVRKEIRGDKYEIATRNFPMTPGQLATSLKIKPGGDRMIFGFRVGKTAKPVTVICKRFRIESTC